MSTGVVPLLGLVWSLLVLALGVVAIRDVLVYADVIHAEAWVEQALGAADNRSADSNAITAVAVVLIVVGLWIVALGLRPRPRRHVAVRAETGVFISRNSVRRLAAAAAATVDGVDTAAVSVSNRRVKVAAVGMGQPGVTQEEIRRVVSDRLTALAEPPTVKVDARGLGGSA